MSIFEAIGGLAVIYMTCVGIAAHGWLVIAGLKRLSSRLEIGAELETSGVRDALGMSAAHLEIRRTAN